MLASPRISAMRNLKLTIAYDGSAFHGWQMQPGVPTVQGTIVDVLGKITQERIWLQGASRTDAGVHALGQTANFRTHSKLEVVEFQRALNSLLPPTVRIVEAEERGPEFNARWNANGKTYCYRIFRGLVLPPFEWGRVLHYPWPLDEAAMTQAAGYFEGRHDFSTFAASSGSEEDDRDRDMTREITRAEFWSGSWSLFEGDGVLRPLVKAGSIDELVFVVRGKSFLRYMVRKIVGTLLDVGKGKRSPGDIPDLFKLKDRSKSGSTAPPEGLYLLALEYPDPLEGLLGTAHMRQTGSGDAG
jgi:tRNA pseudouridine38-40 synthase